ncbi:AAA family ATPase [Bacteroidales bacterium OttesenSCG-928-A17]|nr:AAA family ATPase [Bacteroidales bacterium OttesenSCG-928-A17]
MKELNKNYVSGEELLSRKVEEIPCIVNPLLQKVGLACIAGSSDCGKSSFLRNLCMTIVSGEDDFIGFEIEGERRRAIYVSTEDDETAVEYLLNRQNKDMQLTPKDLKGLRFVFNTTNLIENLDNMMAAEPVDIVCIDALADIYGKSMNESNQVRAFLNEYSQLAQRHQCLILFLHHCGKRTEETAPNKNNLLGSQGIEAKMRLVMELRTDITIPTLKHLCIVKGNYLPSGSKQESYQLRFTENMTFENTGERVPFENLIKQSDDGKQKYEQIKELQAEGLTQEQIASQLGYSHRSSVSRLIAKFEKSKPKSPMPDGELPS